MVDADNLGELKSAFFKATKNSNNTYDHCCVDGCSNNRKINYCRLFKFPCEENMKLKWMENLSISINTNIKNLRVCADHFDSKFLGLKKLKSGAVPNKEISQSENTLHNPLIKKKFVRNYNKCCVTSCNSTNVDTTLFRFPKDENTRKQWLLMNGLEENIQTKTLKICSFHFEAKFLGKKKLLQGALLS